MFINEMKKTLNDEFNVSQTENAALGYRTTGKALLDVNFKVASLRAASESEIIDLFMKAFYEDKQLAVKWLFYTRDAREGLGERRLFRIIVEYLSRHNPEVIKHLIPFIPEYGRYDDMWSVLDTQHAGIVMEIVQAQLKADQDGMSADKPISLLAKWLPSPNTSSKATVAKARQIIKMLDMNEATYSVALVSGFSVNIVRMVLSGELDPYKCLVDQLMSERYAQITI
jgi:hypothetical protein